MGHGTAANVAMTYKQNLFHRGYLAFVDTSIPYRTTDCNQRLPCARGAGNNLCFLTEGLPLAATLQSLRLLPAAKSTSLYTREALVIRQKTLFMLQPGKECDKILVRHNSICLTRQGSVHFYFGKNAHSFSILSVCLELCRSNRSYAFFRAWLRSRTFLLGG